MAGLYLHIPFCHSKCAYCDFYSMPQRDPQIVERLCDALVAEFEMRRGAYSEFGTVYLGGGTPSILSTRLLAMLVERLPKDVAEFTIEANPEDASLANAEAWRGMGIDRVSMGVQSLVDSELRIIGRRHSAQQALEAYGNLRKAGFGNISLDLIYGLPGQTISSWRYSIEKLLDLQPEHFSAYMLSYEPRTRLTAMLQSGKIKETAEDDLLQMYDILTSVASERGYEHYEISNFARSGMRAKHNSSYWTGVPYLGLGPGAHSFDGNARRYNPSNLKEYLTAIESGKPASVVDEEEECSKFNDIVMTALRTADGLDTRKIKKPRLEQLMLDAAPYVEKGIIVVDGPRLTIPEKSWLISDAVISDLFQLS